MIITLYVLPGVTKWLSKTQDVMQTVYHQGREKEKLVLKAVCFLRNHGDWRFGLSGARTLVMAGPETVGTEAPKTTLRGEWGRKRVPGTYSFILVKGNILVSTFL